MQCARLLTSGRLDANALEKLRMAERQLDQLADLSHLLAAAANVVIAHVCKVVLLVLALDRIALVVNGRVRTDNTVRRGLAFHNLEFNRTHASAHDKHVTLVHGAVLVGKIWLQVHVKQIARHALHRVVNGKNLNLGPVHCLAWMQRHNVAESDAQVASHD